MSLIDPNGECSQPAGLQPGEIGVCVDLFIAAPTIGVIGVGDNRGPVSNDPSATFRVEYSIVYDPADNMTQVSVTTGVSSIFFAGNGYTGSTTGDVNATANGDGSVTVSIDTASLNGVDTAAGTNGSIVEGPIMLDTSLTISPDGTVSVDGGERSAYPSIEVWSYQSGQDPYNVLYIPESGNSGDLGSLNQDLPDTGGDPSATVTPDGSGDAGISDGSGSDSGGGGGSEGGGNDCGDDDANCEVE